MNFITLAIAKGRTCKEVLPWLKQANVHPKEDPLTSRKLIIDTQDDSLKIVVVRPSDVPTYIQYGAADFGIVGNDIILEHGNQGLYQPLNLNLSRCRMCVAAPIGFDYETAIRCQSRLKVATKFIRYTKKYFSNQGIQADVIKLYGAMELAPMAGLAQVIVDLVDTGQTLQANGLEVKEELFKVSSHLIINQASFKLKSALIKPWINTLSQLSSA